MINFFIIFNQIFNKAFVVIIQDSFFFHSLMIIFFIIFNQIFNKAFVVIIFFNGIFLNSFPKSTSHDNDWWQDRFILHSGQGHEIWLIVFNHTFNIFIVSSIIILKDLFSRIVSFVKQVLISELM